MYQPRPITFKEILKIEDWTIKLYTIIKNESLINPEIIENVQTELPNWLNLKNGFNNENDKIGFLIIHCGTEGVFSIINWWVGQNMLNTHIFFSDYSNTKSFKKISGNGLAPCIWELEVIGFEKKIWTENIIKKFPNPDFNNYINNTLSTII